MISECDDKKVFDEYNAIAAQMAEDYSDELMEKMNALQEVIDARDLWDIDSKDRAGHGGAALPSRRLERGDPFRW